VSTQIALSTEGNWKSYFDDIHISLNSPF